MWKLVSVRLERALILTQDRCTVCVGCTIGIEIILDAPMDLLGDVGHVESRFSPFGDIVSVECKIGAQFRVKHTIFSEIILDAPDGTPK